LRTLFKLFLLAIIAAAAWLAWGLALPLSPPGQKFLLLRPGFSTRRIANELRDAGVIRSADAFLLWHYLHHRRSLKAGEYLFEKTANAVEVHKRLVHGDIYVHTVVIPEGFNVFEVAEAMQDAGLCSKQEFLDAAMNGSALISDLAPEATSLEGYLSPNTYEFTRTQTTTEMLDAMVKQFRQVARQIGLNSDVHKTVTLASIIEKETSVPDETTMVASVYYNRLQKNMPLQADPCVIYAELLKGTYTGALHHPDMQFNSAYNTYIHTGLPPGPIANPGKTSLEAAMQPGKTDYIYFVSDGSGHHRFAQSLEEHNRNVAAYRKAVEGK
jgi:UPF0755 protein